MRIVAEDSTITFLFNTSQFSTGAPFTLAGTPSLAVYVDGGATQVTAGITLTVDFDSKTGMNKVSIDLSASASYTAGSHCEVVIEAGTVDSVSAVGKKVYEFQIGTSGSQDQANTRTLLALPNAAADAAGGLPISDAGGLDLDNRMPSATSVGNMNIVFATDFASNYDATNDLWLARLDNGVTHGGSTAVFSAAQVLMSRNDASPLVILTQGGSGHVLDISSDDATNPTIHIENQSSGPIVQYTGGANNTYIDNSGNFTGLVAGIAGTIQTFDALDTALDSAHGAGSWATATGFSTLTEADVRNAVGLAAANLDTQLGALPTLAEIFAGGDIDGFDLEEAMKLILAASAGKLSGAATATIIIRSADDTANRITATVDADGNRSAVTLNAAG